MSTRVRKEEYTSLGDFIRTSFARDQAEIEIRFPKLNRAFLVDFTTKLEAIKVLESGLVLTEEQKLITYRLYDEAGELNKELNFLKNYFNEAGLNVDIIEALKKDLSRNNIEGAVSKIESLKQFVSVHVVPLVNEGMSPEFAERLNAHRLSLGEKNNLQNNFMNNRKALTNTNIAKYKDLYDSILKITRAGKLVFDGKITKDEYNIAKTVGRMRSARQGSSNKAA